MRRFGVIVLGVLAVFQAGCGGGASGPPPPPPVQVLVSVQPSTASPRAGQTQQFTATVTGTANTTKTWLVNGIVGGDVTVGAIDAMGLYTSPAVVPTPNTVTVSAISNAVSTASDTSSVTLLNPLPVLTVVNPTIAGVGSFTLAVGGTGFVNGSQIAFGGTAVATTFVSSTQLRANVTATAGQAGSVNVSVSNPSPGAANSGNMALQVISGNAVTAAAAARFLEQATFGPTPNLINQVQHVGFANYLNDQFTAPISIYPDPLPTDTLSNPLQQRFYTNALFAPDQLRQRMAFALHKIWVVSWVSVSSPQAFTPYLNMFQQDTFTHYRTITEHVSLNPAMGRYQDIANNDKPDPVNNINANENYGRELLQLFTIGVWQLNSDGTIVLDGQGNPVPAYDPVDTVQNFARAMTGWTYPTLPGRTQRWPNPINYVGQLEPIDIHHDMTAGKALLSGLVLPANQTARQDMTELLDNIFNHPNIAPWVAKLLIQQFTTSNPSPAYVARVVQAFTSGTANGVGSGQRGDMKAVITAVLLDTEARRGDDPATAVAGDGKLREPILFMSGVLRAFGAASDGAALINRGANMGQRILFPPTVFSYFSPEYLIPGTSLLGPEYQLQTTATSFERINFLNTFAFGSLGGGTTVDFSAYATLAANPANLLNALDALLLHGTMSSAMRTSITTAINAVPAGASQNLLRARTAIYLITSSSQYQVQR